MTDNVLLNECLIFLKAMEHVPLNQQDIARATILFTEACTRPALQDQKQDFETVLKVLKVL